MKPLYLDVILPNGRFLCQLAYIATPKNMIITDREVLPVYYEEDLKNFVLQKRPTLKNVDFKIELTNNIL